MICRMVKRFDPLAATGRCASARLLCMSSSKMRAPSRPWQCAARRGAQPACAARSQESERRAGNAAHRLKTAAADAQREAAAAREAAERRAQARYHALATRCGIPQDRGPHWCCQP